MKPIIFIPVIEATALANINTFDFNLLWKAFDSVWTSLGAKVREFILIVIRYQIQKFL